MNNDVTAGYIMKDVERLRKPMQQVTNFMLEYMMNTMTIFYLADNNFMSSCVFIKL